MIRAMESVLMALALLFLTHLLLLWSRATFQGEELPGHRPPWESEGGLGVDETDELRTQLLRYIREDLGGPPGPSSGRTAGALGQERPVREIRLSSSRLGVPMADHPPTFGSWLLGLPQELLSPAENGPLRRFFRTLAAFGIATGVWFAFSLCGVWIGRLTFYPEIRLLLAGCLFFSFLPVFWLAVAGGDSIWLVGFGAAIFGGLAADGVLVGSSLTQGIPGYVRASYGRGYRWWSFAMAGAIRDSLEWQLMRPKVPMYLYALRSRLPLLLGGVIVAELAVDAQGLSRTFNNFDQASAHCSFLTGVLLTFVALRMLSWLVRWLEIATDPALSSSPDLLSKGLKPVRHRASFSLLRARERFPFALFCCVALLIILGVGWAVLLIASVWALWREMGLPFPRSKGGESSPLGPAVSFRPPLGWLEKVGILCLLPFVLPALVPAGWLVSSPLLESLAGTTRMVLTGLGVMLLFLRPILVMELRGGLYQRAWDALVHGLESLPQVLVAILLIRPLFALLDATRLDSIVLRQVAPGLVLGLFGVAFLVRALVDPLRSSRQQRHVRSARVLGLEDRTVLTTILQGNLRVSLISASFLATSLMVVLDLYVGFIFQQTLTTGGAYARDLGQLIAGSSPLRAPAMALAVLALVGFHLLRMANEQRRPR